MCLQLLSRDSLTFNCRLQSLEAAGPAVMIGIYQDFVVLLLLFASVFLLLLFCHVMLLFS